MNKGYWLVRADITDFEKFKEYASRTPAVIEKFGGRFLARAGTYEVVEGNSRTRNSVIEFPSYDSALACWNSAEYQHTKTYRIGGAELDIVIVEGCD